MDVFHDRPGNGEAVIGAGAAPDLVEHDQAAWCRVGQDVGRFQHLDHERALTGRDIILCPDPGEDAIDDADAGLVGGNERADLGHQRDQCHLPQPRTLAGHVRAGQDDDLVGIGIEQGVVGHVLAGWEYALDHGMPPGNDFDAGAVGEIGTYVVAFDRHFGQGADGVDPGNRICRPLEAFRMLGHAQDQRAVDIGFERCQRIFRRQDQRLVFLQLRCEVAGGVGQRLLGNVVVGQGGAGFAASHPVAIGRGERGSGDFEVVAEHPVVANLEGANASPVAFAPLQIGDPLPGFGCTGPMCI